MKDFTGKELHVGDDIVYLQHYKTSSHLYRGKVAQVKEKTVMISENGSLRTRKEPHKVVKLAPTSYKLLTVTDSYGYSNTTHTVGLFSSEEELEKGKAAFLEELGRRNKPFDAAEYYFSVMELTPDVLR